MSQPEKTFKPYIHEVQYYETDAMRVAHHSNFIRWMEEARHDFLIQLGVPYEKLERSGIIIPVLAVDCEYKHAVHYSDFVKIFITVESFSGLFFEVSYRMVNLDDTVIFAQGKTKHCFLDSEMKPTNIKKRPELYKFFEPYRD